MSKSRFKRPNQGQKQPSKRKNKKKPKPYQMHDNYFLKAKAEWYRARSVYKLIEIQEKFGIIKENMNVCDIWAAPWSFIQYTKRLIKDTGQIVWIDLKPINKYSQNKYKYNSTWYF